MVEMGETGKKLHNIEAGATKIEWELVLKATGGGKFGPYFHDLLVVILTGFKLYQGCH